MDYQDQLHSERLTTRFLTEDDIILWKPYFEHPANCKFMLNPDNLSNDKRAEQFIHWQLSRYNNDKLGLQAILLKDRNELVGTCGLLVQEVDEKEVIEIGYHFLMKYWGNGYATEAAQLFRDYGFEHNFANSIVSLIDPGNEPSKRVAKRNGMTLYKKDALFRGEKYNMFRITKDYWSSLS